MEGRLFYTLHGHQVGVSCNPCSGFCNLLPGAVFSVFFPLGGCFFEVAKMCTAHAHGADVTSYSLYYSPQGPATCVTFSQNGEYFASGSSDEQVNT